MEMSRGETEARQREYLKHQIRDKTLVDLHTHLLGMGDHKFWITLMHSMRDEPNRYLPECYPCAVEFSEDPQSNQLNASLERREEKISRRKALIQRLLDTDTDFGGVGFGDLPTNNLLSPTQFSTLAASLTTIKIPEELELLVYKESLSLKNQTLTNEVVYSEQRLMDSLVGPHITVMTNRSGEEARKLRIKIKQHSQYREWLVFDTRRQMFQVVRGITNSALLDLFDDGSVDLELLRNAFTMLEGGQQTFTPHFYPRRFALKDAMYEHSLVVLQRLLDHVLPIYYEFGVCRVEFSVGYQDLVLRPWVFNRLTKNVDETRLRQEGKESLHFYFLAGLPRFKLFLDLTKEKDVYSSSEASELLATRGEDLEEQSFDLPRAKEMYRQPRQWLRNIQIAFSYDSQQSGELLLRVLGLDWFGDEIGLPYCPFWLPEFREFAQERTRNYETLYESHYQHRRNPFVASNRGFGLRPHLGEVSKQSYINILGAEHGKKAYKRHVSIVVKFVDRLVELNQNQLGFLPMRLRLGHGVCVMYHEFYAGRKGWDAPLLETNLTSNSVLIPGISIAEHPVKTIVPSRIIVIGTDDDGIIEVGCDCVLKHRSVAAEYCKAISAGIIPEDPRLWLPDPNGIRSLVETARHEAPFFQSPPYMGVARANLPFPQRQYLPLPQPQPRPLLLLLAAILVAFFFGG